MSRFIVINVSELNRINILKASLEDLEKTFKNSGMGFEFNNGQPTDMVIEVD